MLSVLKEDLRAASGREPTPFTFLRSYLFDVGFRAVVYHRIAHWLHIRGVKYVPMLIAARCIKVTGTDILPQAEIGPGLVIKHPVGLVVGYRARIGSHCTLLQNVTIGEKYSAGTEDMYPVIGNDVTIASGAAVLGPIRVGDGAVIGANSVVIHDVPAGAVVVGAPARVIATRDAPREEYRETSGRPQDG